MYPHNLDHISDHLKERIKERESFAGQYGQRAASFLDELPALFQLYRRVPFDADLTVDARRFAALCALYIAEHQDFLPDHGGKDAGLIDDVWLAFRALPMLIKMTGGPALVRHWRGDASLDDVQGMAANVSVLSEKVPPKVLEAAARYLGVDL